MSNGFTKIDNSILEDQSISFDAKGIYAILSRYISIPGFKINKSHIKSVTGLGLIRFNRAWKELKEKGLLIQTKTSVNGRFEYTYSLGKEKSTAPVEEKLNKKPVDSDGNAPIEGQIYIDEVIEPVDKDVDIVTKETGFNKGNAMELLRAASNNILKIIQAYKYALQQSNVKNLFKYTLWCIKNNVCHKENKVKTSTFNDYAQRKYDYDKLEKALLYGEEYELPV
ncbi:hypothetical protein [Clostridium sp. KNHs214]|uniref:hypothetical protein n=1 Tax=Clostridium sp. KNHs214 TaxID=1540257 RepID=UPI000557F382|nr:hypothetical protein [Clostridium sp. KNHs214]